MMFDFYKFLFHRINKNYKVLFVFETLFLLFLNITQILIPIIQKHTIDNMLTSKSFSNELLLMGIVSALGILLSFFNIFIRCSLIYHFERRLQLEMIVSSYLKKNKIIDSKGPGAYLVSIFGDTEHVAQILCTNIFETVAQIIASGFILVYSLQWSASFFYIIIVSYVLLVIVNIISSRLYGKTFSNGREKVMEINPIVLEQIENRTSILGYGNVHLTLNQLVKDFKERDKYFKKANVIEAISTLCGSAINVVTMLVFFITSMYQIMRGEMSMSAFIALLTCFSYIYLPVNSIKNYFIAGKKFNMLKKKIDSGMLSEIKFKMPLDENIEFDNCTYEYEQKDDSILRGLSFSINKKIGIVGLSGEGKSTIVKLILGELVPTEGKCICGDIESSSIHRNIIYSLVRYYKQDAELFNKDLEYNIVLGKKGVSDKEYKNMIGLWNSNFKHSLTHGNDKELFSVLEELFFVGGKTLFSEAEKNNLIIEMNHWSERQFEMLAQIYVSKNYYVIEKYKSLICELNLEKLEGRNLGQHGNMVSGGEKNRIMLARFLLPEYGNVFIIDEPFTSLDIINEKECFNVLKKYTKSMVGVIISHKMKIIQDFCDDIIVIEDGKITSRGPHNKLMGTSNLYQTLCQESKNR